MTDMIRRRSRNCGSAATLDVIAPHGEALASTEALRQVGDIARGGVNDAVWLRSVFAREHSLHEAVRQQCLQWRA